MTMVFAAFIRRKAQQGGLLALFASVTWAASNCDLNQDGLVNVIDVQLITNMILGTTPCTAHIAGAGQCTDAVRTVVINTALGGGCHSASLSWTASTSPNVTYNIYRSMTSGGPYTKLNSSLIATTTYLDTTVQAGQTYYYVVTAVDASNNESPKSIEVKGAVPTP
jgi:hypothetical protein